jgi:hypothetical protein
MNTTTRKPRPAPTEPRFVAATPEDIRRAEELRRAIERRYLKDAAPPPSRYWTVGAD